MFTVVMIVNVKGLVCSCIALHARSLFLELALHPLGEPMKRLVMPVSKEFVGSLVPHTLDVWFV